MPYHIAEVMQLSKELDDAKERIHVLERILRKFQHVDPAVRDALPPNWTWCGDCKTYAEVERTDYHAAKHEFNREIVLHNIEVTECKCGDAPVIPALSRLIEEIQSQPKCKDFYWNQESRQWATPS